ncbi:MAG: DUF4912 domain-containing protein [Planctomycetaceae bacterium]|jgi:hypothetical protein|nr:DUF4912 domain-containing protein [Planctomycetaceae bacterium]
MVTVAGLKLLTVKLLSDIARHWEVVGWHEMRKDELVRVIANRSRTKLAMNSPMKPSEVEDFANAALADAAKKAERAKNRDPRERRSSAKRKPRPVRLTPEQKLQQLRQRLAQNSTIRTSDKDEDRFVLLVRGPYWIQAYWEISRRTIERAKVALAHNWHATTPILRVYKIVTEHSSHQRRIKYRDIPIHGGVSDWFIDVLDPPCAFQVEIGYAFQPNNFYLVAASNIVTTPHQQKDDGETWQDVDEMTYEMSIGASERNDEDVRSVFEDKLHRPMNMPMIARSAAERTRRNFDFSADADIVIYGQAEPGVQVAICDEPVRLSDDGRFTVRRRLPEKRHVFAVDAVGSDGVEKQRIIMAIERNTKIMETLFVEPESED